MNSESSARQQGGVCKDRPLTIVATGMVTGVGLNTASSCAAIRAAIDNFQETNFLDVSGEPIIGCEVQLDRAWRGTRKLAKMLARAIIECAEEGGASLVDTPVIICLSEKERPGRMEALGNKVFFETQEELDAQFHRESEIIEHGRVGPMVALQYAHTMLYQNGYDRVIVAGVDSLLTAPVIREFQERDRLLTSRHSDGFIPGEAAAAILVGRKNVVEANSMFCLGLGFSTESATIDSGQPLRADGLTAALTRAFEAAGATMNEMDFRIVDVAGEQYWFKETSLAMSRLLRTHKSGFPLWHITDCIGETGAAIVLLSIAYLKLAFEKSFAPGFNVYQHASNDDRRRAAAIYTYGRL